MEASSISRHCCSRIGLLGNPSDGYGGKCVSIAISNFSATVTLVSSPVLRFIRHPVHDNVSLPKSMHAAMLPCIAHSHASGRKPPDVEHATSIALAILCLWWRVCRGMGSCSMAQLSARVHSTAWWSTSGCGISIMW